MKAEEKFDYKNLLIAIIIVVVFLILGFVNYQQFLVKQTVSKSFDQINTAFKQEQDKALWGEKYQGTVPLGYGIYIETTNNLVKTFVDLNENMSFDESEVLEQFYLTNEVELKAEEEQLTILFEKYKKIRGICLNQDCNLAQNQELFELVSVQNEFFSKKVILDVQTGILFYE